MTTMIAIERAAANEGLSVVGAFHPSADDLAPGIATLCLLGAADDRLWAAFQAAPEAADGAAHPMDRWSKRVITSIADALDAAPFFPFGGPPWAPFQRWAARGEQAVASPVGMQATGTRGLWTSYRGALGFSRHIAIAPQPSVDPCRGCPAPCLTACPVEAFASGRYDVPRCTGHVLSRHGARCQSGCLVRVACPAGAAIELPEAQRRFHMDAFLRANG